MEWLYHIDLMLFHCVNHTIANPFFDWLMPFLTEIKNWYAAYLVAVLALLLFGKKQGRIVVLLLIPTIILSDQISSSIIKPLVGRIRPCHVVEGVRLIYGTAGGLSFPSSHAVNNFAIASVLSHFYPRFFPYLFLFASIVALSRVYLGLHYPSDMVGGAAIGIFIGTGITYFYEQITKMVKNKHSHNENTKN